MNHKPWHWRKRSMEKTIFAVDKVVSPSGIREELHKSPTAKEAEFERSSGSLNEKLASVLLDCHVEEDPSEKHAQMCQQETSGKDQTKQVVESLEEEVDEDLGKEASHETVAPTDAKLQEPLQPLSFVQEEQEQRFCGAIPKISREHEKIQKELEGKLQETNKRIVDLTAENTRITGTLLAKEKYIEDLLRGKRQADAELSTLMARLDSTEKENAFLRYEFHMLEKELEIRKEEMDYSRQYAEASHKQYVESAQKVSKLEAECQRLRLLLKKRSPGPTGLVNLKNEVGMMRRETDMRRRKPNPARDLIYKSNDIGNSAEVSETGMSLMIKCLQDLDEENKALKRILTQKNTELDSSRIIYAETASRLSQAEVLLRKLSESQKAMELTRCYPASKELYLTSKFDIPDMSLMDDFVEMEKRAIVSVDAPKRGYCSDKTGRELVPVEQDLAFKCTTEKSFDWLQIVLSAMLEEKSISKRSLDELFEDIKFALGCIKHSTQKSRHSEQSGSFDANGFSGVAGEKNKQHFNSNLKNSVHRIIKLVEGIAPKSFICNNSPDCLEGKEHSDISQSPTPNEYFVHVFQWKVSDLNPLLHRLVHSCKDLLTGRADFENFIEEVAFALDWFTNNSATPRNASYSRDKIRKQLSFHLSQNENENKVDVDDKDSFRLPSVADPDEHSMFFDKKNNEYDLFEENRKLKEELMTTKSEKQDIEGKLLSVTGESQNLRKQCQEAQVSIKGLESEIETLKDTKGIIEDQIEKQKLINEDLDTQLTIARSKLNDIFQKFSSLEVELDDKKNSCEELEATCLELQLQLESIAKKETPAYGRHEVEKIYQTGWEITTASSKLAECQESILNLGKQLKALASSSEVALFDRVLSTTSIMANPTHRNKLIKRSSLRTQMLAEDDAKEGIHEESKSTITSDAEKPPLLDSENGSSLQAPKIMVNAQETTLPSEKNDCRSNATGALTIVQSKKQGGFGFLRKLLLRRKKGKGKGTQLLAKT